MPASKVRTVWKRPKGLPYFLRMGICFGGIATSALILVLYEGSKNGNLNLPTASDLLGKWQSMGTSNKDIRTYTGIYDFHSVGSHTYDITLSDGVEKQGRGFWRLTKETGYLQVENDTGSVYVGTFQDENFSRITLKTTNEQWGLVLKKEEVGSATPAPR